MNTRILPVDAWDRVAQDRVKGGEEECIRGRLHDEQGSAHEQDLQHGIY